jgi:HNH endonuclease
MARQYISTDLKSRVFNRANGICEYCFSQVKFSPNNFEIEHIIPVSLDGETIAENLALACPSCNSCKSNKIEAIDAVSDQTVRLFHPRQMLWNEHFTWSDDTILMFGTSPIGRATVALLQTNRSGVVNLRRILSERGEHPPAAIGEI